MTSNALPLALAALVLATAPPAAAQYQMMSPMLYNGPQISLQAHANSAASASAAASATPRAAVAPAAVLTYRPDPARRRGNLARFVETVRRIDPQGAANLSAEFAKGDFMEQVQAGLRPFGLRVDNVADAFAAYWISAYQASRGETGPPARAMVDAVKAQTARVLAAAPAVAQAGDGAKQDMAEALWIQTALLDSAAEGAKGDAEQMRRVGQAAVQGARGVGLDLSRVTLTDRGFEAKGG